MQENTTLEQEKDNKKNTTNNQKKMRTKGKQIQVEKNTRIQNKQQNHLREQRKLSPNQPKMTSIITTKNENKTNKIDQNKQVVRTTKEIKQHPKQDERTTENSKIENKTTKKSQIY